MSDDFNVDDFYAEVGDRAEALESRSTNYEDRIRIQKMWMNAPDNQGKARIIPYQDQTSKKFFSFLDGVKEIKLYDEASDNVVWWKLLPLEKYGPLSPADEALHAETSSLFETIRTSEWLTYTDIRVKSYALIYGYLIAHYNKKNVFNAETSGKPTMLVLPSVAVASAVRDGMNSVKNTMNGSMDWARTLYNNDITNRQGYLEITFWRGDTGGYTVVVGHNFTHQMDKTIPDGWVLPDNNLELFKDLTSDFLGKATGSDAGLWNREYVELLKKQLERIVVEHSGGATMTEVTTNVAQPYNQPSADPMLAQGAPSNIPAPMQAVVPQHAHAQVDPMQAQTVQQSAPAPQFVPPVQAPVPGQFVPPGGNAGIPAPVPGAPAPQFVPPAQQ